MMLINSLTKLTRTIVQKTGTRFVEQPFVIKINPHELKYVGDVCEFGGCAKAAAKKTAEILKCKQEIAKILTEEKALTDIGINIEYLERILQKNGGATPEKVENIRLLLKAFAEEGGFVRPKKIAAILDNPEFFNPKNQEMISNFLEDYTNNNLIILSRSFTSQDAMPILSKLYEINKTARNPVLSNIYGICKLSLTKNLKEAMGKNNNLSKIFAAVDKNNEHILSAEMFEYFENDANALFTFFSKREDLICKEIFDLIPFKGRTKTASEIFHDIISKNPKISKEEFLSQAKSLLSGKFKIKNPLLKNLDIRNDYKTNELLYEIEMNLDGFKDARIISHIKEELEGLKDIDEAFKNEKLEEILELLEVVNIADGKICSLGRGYNSGKYMDELKRMAKDSEPDSIYKIMYDNRKCTISRGEDFGDILSSRKYERLIEYCKSDYEGSMSNYLYNAYYLKNANIARDAKLKLSEINKKYGCKIFIPCFNKGEKCDIKALEYVDEEFRLWRQHSNGTAEYPKTLDYLATKTEYLGTTGGYQCGDNIAIYGLYINPTLRHEMTHLNTRGCPPIEIDTEKLFPKINVTTNGVKKERPDINKSPFYQELINAGITAEHAEYGCTNWKELLAVAMEAPEKSKFSESFKKTLKAFGLEDYMLEMPFPTKYAFLNN